MAVMPFVLDVYCALAFVATTPKPTIAAIANNPSTIAYSTTVAPLSSRRSRRITG